MPVAAGLVVIAAIVAALALGLVAYTASPILIAAAAALVVGPVVLARPLTSIWALLVGGLLIIGVVPIWAEGQGVRVAWALSGLSLMLMVLMLFKAVTLPRAVRGTPAFVWLLLAFVAFVLFNGLIQWSSAYEYLSGFKRYFQAIGLMLAVAWLGLSDRQMLSLRKLIVVVVLFQLPWATYELLELVPRREALRFAYSGLVPIDVVAGTFGASLTTGGANAEMATFLLVVLTFLLARMRERIPGAGRKLLLLAPFVLAPLLLGETKVVIVLLPLVFALLYRRELVAKPHVGIAAVVVGGVLTLVAATAYVFSSQHSLERQIQDTIEYNFKERGHGNRLLNRTTVLSFWADRQTASDPVSPVLGHGLGAAHDATGGHIARRFPAHGISLTAASILLWEQGLFGFLLYLAIWVAAWRSAGVLRLKAAEAWVRADAAAIQVAVALFFVYTFYRAAMLEGFPFQLFAYGLLGYLAWLSRREQVVRVPG